MSIPEVNPNLSPVFFQTYPGFISGFLTGQDQFHMILGETDALKCVGRFRIAWKRPTIETFDSVRSLWGCRRFDQARSKRSRFMTLSHAATKSVTNFSPASADP